VNIYESVNTFDRLYRKAFWKRLTGALKHHRHRLLPLRVFRELVSTKEEVYRGIQAVPVAKIVGTENRFYDFDREFLPLRRQDRYRWARIHNLYRDQSLPPVSLIKIGDFYFVRDGHHRISVAKAEKVEYIDAEVVEIPLPSMSGNFRSPEEFFHHLEEQIFREKTRLKDIQVTILGGYFELLYLISCFQCSDCSKKREAIGNPACLPWQEAVEKWYTHCYQPAIEVIEKSKIVSRFKNRTPTDLYLWTLYNLDLLRKASCFVPSHPPTAIAKKPSSLYRLEEENR